MILHPPPPTWLPVCVKGARARAGQVGVVGAGCGVCVCVGRHVHAAKVAGMVAKVWQAKRGVWQVRGEREYRQA